MGDDLGRVRGEVHEYDFWKFIEKPTVRVPHPSYSWRIEIKFEGKELSNGDNTNSKTNNRKCRNTNICFYKE